MASASPLSAAQESRDRGGVALARAPAVLAKVNAPEFRRSAEISSHPRLCLNAARTALRGHAKAVIYGAFPARSRHQTCVQAAQACGCSPDTIARLIEGETGSPDVLVLAYCARVYRDRTGKVTPICSLLAQIIAVESFA